MTSLFDEIARNRDGAAKYGERDFDYVNSSSRRPVAALRSLLDGWWLEYPEGHQEAIRARIRSRSDIDFLSASFELALHHLFRRQECSLVALEDRVASGRAPDFLFQTKEGERFRVEATVAWDKSDNQRSAETRLEEAIQALDEVRSPHFHLSLETTGFPVNAAPRRAMSRSLQRWVDDLPEQGSGEDVWQYSVEGCTFAVKATYRRKKPEHERAIGIRHLEPYSAAPHEALREAIIRKAKRYGSFPEPFVIAVNMANDVGDESDYLSALYGSEAVSFPVTPHGVGEARHERLLDGVWRGRRGAQRRGLSAVLFFQRFSAWRAARGSPLLAINPWADKPLNSKFAFRTSTLVEGRLSESEGASSAELFDLPVDWPPGD